MEMKGRQGVDQNAYKEPAAVGGPGGYGGAPAAAGAPGYGMPAPNAAYGVPPQPPTAGYGYPPQSYPVGTPPVQNGLPPLGQWTSGLCDCGNDPLNCIITCVAPWFTFGQVAEIVDEGTTSCIVAAGAWLAVAVVFGVPCCVSCLWRTKLRAKYGLPDSEVGDFCIHCWCEHCALCQEYRELKNRGLDPMLGWELHRQRLYAQSNQVPMGAPQQANMQR